MEIRPIKPTDNKLEISRIYEESWKFAYQNILPQRYLESIPAGQWIPHLEKEEMHHLVMIENDLFIGTASYCKARTEDVDYCGEIVSIYLLPAYIGRGYGYNLFKAAMGELIHSGYRKIVLWVLEENQRARKFYEKAGFASASHEIEEVIGGKKLKELQYYYQIE